MFEIKGGMLVVSGKPAVRTKAQALEMSIEKWRFIVRHLREVGEVVADGGVETCGLCWKYWKDGKCRGCPVGSRECWGTPYRSYVAAVRDGRKRAALEAAEAELSFLEGLRERV